MKDRIAKILSTEGMTAAKLAEEIGVQASGISHILSGRNNPSTDFVIKILERFRGINSEWLLLGKGNMYKTHSTTETQAFETSSKSPEINLFSTNINSEPKYSTPSTLENDVTKSEIVSEHSVPDQNTSSSFTPSIESKTDRSVEKIIVLFNDGTFDYYNSTKK